MVRRKFLEVSKLLVNGTLITLPIFAKGFPTKMIILGCFGGITILETPIYPRWWIFHEIYTSHYFQGFTGHPSGDWPSFIFQDFFESFWMHPIEADDLPSCVLKTKDLVSLQRKYMENPIKMDCKHESSTKIIIMTTNKNLINIWVFPKIGVPQNGWFIMENPYFFNGWFGGFSPPIFGNIQMY